VGKDLGGPRLGDALCIFALEKGPLAGAYNPSYSGGQDQEDLSLSSKLPQANCSGDPVSKIPITKKGLLSMII
jgi:hypothetical protein